MTWYSQAGQDEWVHSIVGDSGFFVDVGAYDGIEHSNTYALEQLGWRGWCIEPNRESWDRLRLNRPQSAYSFPFAASDCHGARPFDGVQMMTVGDQYDCVPVAPLGALLANVGAPGVIDYLSIDVEGHEVAVLAGLDFDGWHVRLATIEHNLYLRGHEHRDAIRDVMIGQGFVLAGMDVVAPGYGPYEDWWIHRDDL